MKRGGFLVTLLLLLLPVGAFATQPHGDGDYTVEVILSGGSGRVGVESPAPVTVTAGEARAVVTWTSPHYEFMLIDGVRYDPVNTDGNAAFEIPVLLGEEMPVSAQTIAMSEPHLIDYTLYFDPTTLRTTAENGTGIIAAATLACVALLAVAWLVRRKRKCPEPLGVMA